MSLIFIVDGDLEGPDVFRMIYLDNAATTRICEEAFSAMEPYLKELYGNSFANYTLGRECGRAVEKARMQTANAIGADPKDIYFTSGGTESDNWAVELACFGKKKGKILISAIEHPAVYNKCMAMKDRGFDVEEIPVSSEGIVSVSDIENRITEDTILVSIMTANNEIGTIQPVKEIAECISRINDEYGKETPHILFHTDAVQAVGHIGCDVSDSGVDMLSASGHKFGGPKGIGFLYVKKGIQVHPLIVGGAQERKMRGGTLNVPAAAGMGAAAEAASKHMEERQEKERYLRERLMGGILENIPESLINGDRQRRLTGNCSVIIPGISSEVLLYRLDQKGIFASAGSACESGAIGVSRILTAIGRSKEEAGSALRLTLSYENTENEIDETIRALREITESLKGGAHI